MADHTAPMPDDRILAYTRVLSAVIIPFLVVAFGLLFLFPDATGRLFAWTIKPTVTSMVLASAYAGGSGVLATPIDASWNAGGLRLRRVSGACVSLRGSG